MTTAFTSAHAQDAPRPAADDRFRLRHFVERLAREGELDTVETPADLADIAARLDGNPKAVLFRKAGPEQAELAGNIMGSRRRLALAFDTSERDLLAEVMKRVEQPIAPVEIASTQAPVHQVVLTGADADFTRLPVHLQHGEDGAPYISAGIDVPRSCDGTRRNVGNRRLMLRGRHATGMDLVAPSDLRAMYGEFVQHRERMPLAFAL
ncbi:MAG: UbiD family decarboxylase, partial [Pseudolabrys sp.]|nr:UbiD family decarboxylase [Pseudolabrys sp.]